MNPTNWQSLEKEFEVEISGEWLVVFKERSFIEQMVKKVFHYYDGASNRPKDRDAWARAINSFCRNNHNQLITNRLSTKPKEFKTQKILKL